MSTYCQHRQVRQFCQFHADGRSVMEAWFALASRHLPLHRGRDRMFVSPEAIRHLPSELSMASSVDVRLRDLEMRLEMAR